MRKLEWRCRGCFSISDTKESRVAVLENELPLSLIFPDRWVLSQIPNTKFTQIENTKYNKIQVLNCPRRSRVQPEHCSNAIGRLWSLLLPRQWGRAANQGLEAGNTGSAHILAVFCPICNFCIHTIHIPIINSNSININIRMFHQLLGSL